MRAERILPLSFFVAMGLAFWKSQTPGQPVGLVRPYRLAGVALVWTVLSALAAASPGLAAAFGGGICVALAMGLPKGQGLGTISPEANILNASAFTGSGSVGTSNATGGSPVLTQGLSGASGANLLGGIFNPNSGGTTPPGYKIGG